MAAEENGHSSAVLEGEARLAQDPEQVAKAEERLKGDDEDFASLEEAVQQTWSGLQLAKEANREGEEVQEEDLQDDASKESLLEDLARLRLSATSESTATSHLPPKQRIKLYQPRTKVEQFEDILLESRMLDRAGLSSSLEDALAAVVSGDLLTEGADDVADVAGTAPLTVGQRLGLLHEYGVVDFEAADAIFSEEALPDVVPAPSMAANLENNENPPEPGQAVGDDEDENCECNSCDERLDVEREQRMEVERLRACWMRLRAEINRVYRLVMDGAWADAADKPDMEAAKECVHKLCWRDPHQLFQRLESGVKEFVLGLKLSLIELLQQQAKNPSLAQDFIKAVLSGYERLCMAAHHVSPALVSLEVEHLRRFSLTWEVLNKHLYHSIIYADPLIQNNVPIFISQVKTEKNGRLTQVLFFSFCSCVHCTRTRSTRRSTWS